MSDTINTSASAGLSLEMRTFYQRVLMGRLLANIVYPLFGQPKPMPTKAGQTQHWQGFDSLPAVSGFLSEGVTPDGDALTMFSVEATPRQVGKFVEITDYVEMTSPDPILTNVVELQGEQAAAKYDTVIRDVISAGTNVQYANGRTSTATVAATDKITLAEVRKVVRTMRTNKIKPLTSILSATDGVSTQPIPASFVAICSPQTEYDLKNISEFIPVHKYSSQMGILPFEIGCLDEVRFIRSDNAKVKSASGASSCDVHCTLILGQGFYGIVNLAGVESIIKPLGAGNDPLNQRQTAGWKACFTAVRLQELACVRLEHGVTA